MIASEAGVDCLYCTPSVEISGDGTRIIRHQCIFEFEDGREWAHVASIGDVRITAVRGWYRNDKDIHMSGERVVVEIMRATLIDARGGQVWTTPKSEKDWEYVAVECADHVAETHKERLWQRIP